MLLIFGTILAISLVIAETAEPLLSRGLSTRDGCGPGMRFLANMYNAGDPDKPNGYDLAAKVCYNYNCLNKTLCLKITAEPGRTIQAIDGESWIKDYGWDGDHGGHSHKYPLIEPPGIQYFSDTTGSVVGWTGCFTVPVEGYRDQIEIHASYNGGQTASTGKQDDHLISMNFTCSGGGYGDPHIKTWAGETYDFHGACDMILVRSDNFANGLGMEIQIRTEIRHDWSFISETAIRIGNEILEIGGHAVYYYNGVQGETLTKTTQLPDLSTFPVKYIKYSPQQHRFAVDLGNKGTIDCKVYNEFVAVGVYNAEQSDFSDSVGLMGSFHDGALVTREGEIVKDTTALGVDWQVQDGEKMLFHEAKAPQFPEKCKLPTQQKIKRRRLLESTVSYKAAKAACADVDEDERDTCIFDILSTGDVGMAGAAL